MKHLFLQIILAISLIFFGSITSSADTLKNVVRDVVQTNPNIRATAFNRLAREQEVRQARSAFFPKIDLKAGIGKDYVEKPFEDELDPQELTLSLRQNVFAGLSTKNEVERQESRVRSQAYLVRSIAENQALRATQVYLAVLENEAVIELSRENLTLHERIADQIKLRSESGVGRRVDMTQIQSRLSLAKSNVVVAEQNLIDARTNYLAVIGHIPEDLSEPEFDKSQLPLNLEEAEALALKQHPTLQSANADLDARHSQNKVAKSPFMPVVDIELDQIYENETNYSFEERQDFRAMLRLRYNLFNGFNDHARKKETTLLISEAREIRNNTHRQVVESIRLSWQAYSSARKRMEYLDERVRFATETAQSYNKQWNIGRRTLLDVLDSEAERIDSIQQLLGAKYDSLYAQYRILNSSGQLLHSLGLKWPEEGKLEEESQDKEKTTTDKS